MSTVLLYAKEEEMGFRHLVQMISLPRASVVFSI